MAKTKRYPGAISLSRKWILRLIGLLLIAVGTLMFLGPFLGLGTTMVPLYSVGLAVGGGFACFIIADFTSD